MTWRNVMSAGAVVGLCGGVIVAGTIWQTDARIAVAADDVSPAVREFLRAAQFSCPEVRSGDGPLVSAASIPGIDGQDEPGKAEIVVAGKSQARVDEPGATAQLDSVTDPVSPIVRATGGLAPGLITARVSDDHSGEGKGLASSPCLAPGAEAWLLGGTAGPGGRNALLLTNPTGTDSLVDVAAYGKGGPLELTNQEGIAVPAGETRTVKLSALAPHVDQLAVRVRTRTGLVSAAVLDDRMEGLTPMGVDVVTDAGDPQRSLVLAAVPEGKGDRELRLLAPGEDSGSVRLTALTASGELPLLDGQPVPVTSGHLSVVDLTDELGGRVAAIRVDADVPVVGAVSATTAVDKDIQSQRAAQVAEAEDALKNAQGDAERKAAEAALSKAETADAIDPGEDLAWFGPAAAVRQAAIAGLRSDLDVTVLLTGTAGTSTVTVGLLPASESHANRRPLKQVEVPANKTVAVPVTAPEGAKTYSVIVTRSSGPGQVHVSHVQSEDGRSITGYAADEVPVWVPTPLVVPSYG